MYKKITRTLALLFTLVLFSTAQASPNTINGIWDVSATSHADNHAAPHKGVLKLVQSGQQVTGKTSRTNSRWTGTYDANKRVLRARYQTANNSGTVTLYQVNANKLRGTWISDSGERGAYTGVRRASVKNITNQSKQWCGLSKVHHKVNQSH